MADNKDFLRFPPHTPTIVFGSWFRGQRSKKGKIQTPLCVCGGLISLSQFPDCCL